MLGYEALLGGLVEPSIRAANDERRIRLLEHGKVRPLLIRCVCFAASSIAALGHTQGQC